jgi:dolichol-phosphate mannosyltransferase
MREIDLFKLDDIAVVIPCYKVRNQIIQVIDTIPNWIKFIIIVDDCCPEESGSFIKEKFSDSRIIVIRNEKNLGVGGSVLQGYRVALECNARIVVKIDGDGQMDSTKIFKLINPILEGKADYTKGNRFYNLDRIGSMPLHRIVGNAGLSFFSKLSTGYWSIFDPNNGFTAISGEMISNLPLAKVDERYFFESDMLFRLNLARAVVVDVAIDAVYGDEKSNLSAIKSIFEFSLKHSRNFLKRLFYNYFLREFSLATINLVLGLGLVISGVTFGVTNWMNSMQTGIPSNTGTLILISMSVLSGLQMLLSFISYDMNHEPKNPIGMHS